VINEDGRKDIWTDATEVIGAFADDGDCT